MSISKAQIVSIARTHLKTALTKPAGITGAAVSKTEDAEGNPRYAVTPTTGLVSPPEELVDDLAAVFADVLYAIIQELTVSVDVACTVSGTVAEGKGSGTVS